MRAAIRPGSAGALARRARREGSQRPVGRRFAIRAVGAPNLADALFKRLDSMEARCTLLQAEIASDRKALSPRRWPSVTSRCRSRRHRAELQAVATELEAASARAMGSSRASA